MTDEVAQVRPDNDLAQGSGDRLGRNSWSMNAHYISVIKEGSFITLF